jgi:alpha-1,3-glucan synthase
MTEADTALFFGRESILLAPLLLTFPGSRIATQYVSFASNNVCISNRKQPLDFSVLDKHYGTIQQWRSAIDEIHRRGMYVMADSTYGT